MNDHDHKSPFCPFCYAMHSPRTYIVRGEGTLTQYLIVADTYQQAMRFANKKDLPLVNWLFVTGKTVVANFPDAQIRVVDEELFRPDLDDICDCIFESGRCLDDGEIPGLNLA